MRLPSFVMLAAVLSSLTGCGDDGPLAADTSNVVAFDAANNARVEEKRLIFPAHLISQEIRDKIDAYDDDRWFWQDDEDVNAEPVILVGDRQAASTDENGRLLDDANNPYGFVRRALSYKLDGTDIIIKTEDATIIDVLEELEANGQLDITSDYPKPPHADTIFIDKSGLELYREGDQFIRFPSLWVNIDPQVDVDLSIGFGHVKNARSTLMTDIEMELVVEARVSELPAQALYRTVYDESYKLAPLGIIPVSLNVRINVGCEKTGGPIHVEGGVRMQSFLQTDITYERGHGSDATGDGTLDATLIGTHFEVTGGTEATLRCVAEPDIRLLYYGLQIASLDVDGNFNLSVQNEPAHVSANFSLRANATGLLSKIAPELGDVDRDFIDIDRQLYDGPAP